MSLSYPNWHDIPTPGRPTRRTGVPEFPSLELRNAGSAGNPSGAAAAALGGRLDPGHEGRVDLLEDHLAVDDALADVVARWQLVHHVEQHLFEDGPQTPGARPP